MGQLLIDFLKPGIGVVRFIQGVANTFHPVLKVVQFDHNMMLYSRLQLNLVVENWIGQLLHDLSHARLVGEAINLALPVPKLLIAVLLFLLAERRGISADFVMNLLRRGLRILGHSSSRSYIYCEL